MLKPVRATQFKKDVKKLAKSGSKDMYRLNEDKEELELARTGSHSELF